MAEHMDFDADRAAAKGESPTFTLCGQVWEMRTDIPGDLVLDYFDAGLKGEYIAQLKLGKELLIESIVPNQRDDFRLVMREGKPGSILMPEVLNEMTLAALKAKAKDLGVALPSKVDKRTAVQTLTGSIDDDGISAPVLGDYDTILAWLTQVVFGRPTTP